MCIYYYSIIILLKQIKKYDAFCKKYGQTNY